MYLHVSAISFWDTDTFTQTNKIYIMNKILMYNIFRNCLSKHTASNLTNSLNF